MTEQNPNIQPLEKPIQVTVPPIAGEAFKDFKGPDEASFDKFILALDRAYHRPWSMMWRSFLQGVMKGMGTVFGFLMMIAILVLLFRAFNGPVWLDNSIDYLRNKFIPAQILDELNKSTTNAQ